MHSTETPVAMNGHTEPDVEYPTRHPVPINGTPKSAAVNGNSKPEVEAPLKEVSTVKPGMECDIKDLYQGPSDNRNRATWTDKYPDDLQDPAENETTAKYAILIRHQKCYNDSRRSLQIHSIVIQSPLLKKVLGTVLKDYPGVTTTLARLTFTPPFHGFVHRWEKLTEALENEEDEITKGHLRLLHKVLKEELQETLDAKADFIRNGVITYEHLWTIIQPGSLVYTTDHGRDRVLKFTQGNYGRTGYQMTCQGIDWDGDKFGYETKYELVTPFIGTKPLTELDCFPLDYHPNVATITEALVARGRLFEKFAGYHYKFYKGTALFETPCGIIRVHADSRVIIDRYAWGRFNPNSDSKVQALEIEKTKPNVVQDDEEDYDPEDDYDDEVDYDDECDDDDSPAYANGGTKQKKHIKHASLTKDQLLCCTPVVKGYALKSKKWLHLFVDTISEIVWNEDAFDNLVLPEDQKELILSFAESQRIYKEKFDDFVSGKGRGIIMLLSGSPGVGKTLTAESVAEHMRVPLYMMGASDLGYSSSQVENALSTILEMVAKWNAVLLIDECDVFLEARNSDNLERNKMVSIFLRTLEYYEGILFLTTNRVDNIDTAFQSRIHVSLEYEPLNNESRNHVWTNFLSRGIDHELTEGDILELSRVDLNGRQIKNILKTSQLLACRKKTPLRLEYIQTVLNIEKRRPDN